MSEIPWIRGKFYSRHTECCVCGGVLIFVGESGRGYNVYKCMEADCGQQHKAFEHFKHGKDVCPPDED